MATTNPALLTDELLSHFRGQKVRRRDLLEELQQRDARVLVELARYGAAARSERPAVDVA